MNTPSIARHARGVTVAATAATVLLTAACGPEDSKAVGTPTPTLTATKPAANGIEAKSGDEIMSAARDALAGAQSVHIKGTTVDSGDTIRLDMFMGVAGSRGTMQGPIKKGKPVSISIITTKQYLYLKSPELWKSAGGAAMAELIGDRWVQVSKKHNADFKELEQEFGDLTKFAKAIFKTDDAVTKGTTTVIDGTPAVAIKSGGDTMYVATTGTPYPIKLVPKKAKAGEGLAFLDYDAPLDLTPPTDAVDLDKLGRQ